MFPNHNILHTVLSNYQSGYYLFISTLTAYTYILQKKTQKYMKKIAENGMHGVAAFLRTMSMT